MALVQLIGMWNMPESPIWLNNKEGTKRAEAALRRFDPAMLVFAEDAGSGNNNNRCNNNRNSPPRSECFYRTRSCLLPIHPFEDILATITPTTGPYSTGIWVDAAFVVASSSSLLSSFVSLSRHAKLSKKLISPFFYP
jgi:hypothetical protein